MQFIQTVRKGRWHRHSGVSWLEEDEFQAAAFLDLKAHENAVSVWCVEDDQSNLEHILAGIAATRDYLAQLDYGVIESDRLEGLGIQIEHTQGESRDREANRNWHRDLVKLTADKLFHLVLHIGSNGIKRYPEKRIRNILAQGVSVGRIRRDELSEHILEKLGLPDCQ